MSIKCHQHTCCWVGGDVTVLPLADTTSLVVAVANAGDTGGDVVVVVVVVVMPAVGNDVGDVWFEDEEATNAGDGFVSSVCFEMTTVVVFWILSWSWCSAGDLGGTEVKASAARTISSTCTIKRRNRKRKDIKCEIILTQTEYNDFYTFSGVLFSLDCTSVLSALANVASASWGVAVAGGALLLDVSLSAACCCGKAPTLGGVVGEWANAATDANTDGSLFDSVFGVKTSKSLGRKKYFKCYFTSIKHFPTALFQTLLNKAGLAYYAIWVNYIYNYNFHSHSLVVCAHLRRDPNSTCSDFGSVPTQFRKHANLTHTQVK